jgi:hypothetical protein
MAKEARVYRVEYETDQTTWNAYIAAFSQEEATRQLYDMLPKGSVKKISAINQQCRLDAVSIPLKEDISYEHKQKINKLLEEISDLKKAKDLRTVPKK